MTTILKYVSIISLAIALVGCQNDSSEETPEQSPQQSEQQSQQQGQPGQMQQESAPEVDLSDEEANTFADAAMAAQEIQMEAQQKMVGIIEDEGLDVETYQKIAQSQQMGQGQGAQGQGSDTAADDISDSDMEKYENATQAIQDAQEGIQEEVASAVEDEGMEMQRFQEISQAAQQDPELQKQIQQKMQEKMSEEGGGGMQQQPPSGNQ